MHLRAGADVTRAERRGWGALAERAEGRRKRGKGRRGQLREAAARRGESRGSCGRGSRRSGLGSAGPRARLATDPYLRR